MSLCKECGERVKWARDSSGSLQCYNADDESVHWDRCSQLKFERVKRTGERFEEKNSAGYYTPFKKSGVQYTHIKAEEVTGKGPSGLCKNCTLPWEEPCAECPDRL